MPHPSTYKLLVSIVYPIAIGTAILLTGAALAAEPFPVRALTLLVPFPAGGVTDALARALAQSMSRQLGQPVVTDNKAGAGGLIGATQVMHAPPDGYTMLMGGPADQVNAPFLMAKPPYDPARDFESVGCVSRAANVLVVNPKLPVQSVADLVRLAKKDPGKLNYGSSGKGSTSHLQGELLAQTAGIDIIHVPYRGSAQALTDTLGGQVQMMFFNPASVMPQIKTGSLRAVAVTSSARIPELPNVPTFREAGLPIVIYSWSCLVVPAKTPSAIVDKLNGALTRALDDPTVLRAIAAAGGEKFLASRDEASRFLAAERSAWGTLIRTRKIQTD